MIDGKFELDVCLSADDPKPLRQYGHEGRTFVEGKPGTSFVLVFRNHSPDRVLAVPSVDGVSVMDGQAATPESEGYVVEPYRRVVIKGWRTSLKGSNKFVFEKKDKSYAEATGQGSATGVIGCLVFREKQESLADQFAELRRKFKDLRDDQNTPNPAPTVYPVYPSWPAYPVYPSWPPNRPWYDNYPIVWCGTTNGVGEITKCSSATHAMPGYTVAPVVTIDGDGTGAIPGTFELGTGWGEAQKDEVKEVDFTRGPQCGVMTIFYSVRKALQRAGVRFDNDAAVPAFPEPFKRKFCEPPSRKK